MFQFICSLKMFTGTPTDVVIKRNLEVVDEEMKLEVNWYVEWGLIAWTLVYLNIVTWVG